tara:strand:+ start:1145 stop:2266 length:1122 start_codon:yes stop_codon:yes gene_type:complete
MNNDLVQRVLYHSVQPQSVQATYGEYNSCDFLINVGEGRSLLPGTIRITGELRVNEALNTRSTGKRTFAPNCGAHAFCDSISVQTQNQGLLENLQNYPRYVNMDATASLATLDMLDSRNQCELRATLQKTSTDYCLGVTPTLTTGTAVTENIDFSFKPLVCLNKADRDMPMARTGTITLQLNLARNMSALFGESQDAATTYELVNLKCHYKSIMDSQNPAPINMGVVYNVKSNILSTTASISANVPAVCDSVAISFIQNQHENVPVYDSHSLESLVNLAEVQYIFNDQTNSLITYNITDQTEMLERAVEAMRNTSHNQVSMDKFRANQSFILGLNFEDAVDLSKNRFTCQIQSGVDNVRPTNVFMYFFARASI